MQIGSMAAEAGSVMPADGGNPTVVTPIVGASPARREEIESGSVTGPQSFSVHFVRPGTTAKAHFHPVDQYQIFIKGSGRLGSSAVQPVVVHYADRFTPYGPILAESDDGLLYLTVRMSPHSGTRPMPECRDERVELGGRHLVADFDSRKLPPGRLVDLIEAHADGLCAWVVRVPPGETLDGYVEPPAGGQQLVALDGDLAYRGERFGAPAIAAFGPGERSEGLSASDRDLTLLSLGFPDPARPPRRERARAGAPGHEGGGPGR